MKSRCFGALLLVAACQTPAPPPSATATAIASALPPPPAPPRDAAPPVAASPAQPRFGHVERFDPGLDAIVPADWKMERLAQGFAWAEGPAWIRSGSYLLFTDVPGNTLHKWSETGGLEVFLKPSGLENPDPKVTREAGLNGLFPLADGSVLAADSGSRVVVRLDLATKKKTPVAAKFNGKRFSSPNDLCQNDQGVTFFTDPPYGLEGINDSKAKELAFNGVFRIAKSGKVELIDDKLSYPNGIGLSPDQKTLYVANCDRERPIWMAYSLDATGKVLGQRLFADAKDLAIPDAPGAPDGLTVASDGTVFATGPGGVLVMNAEGKRLGRISTGKPIANCKFGDDGKSLYLTSHDTLARIRLNVRGQGFTSP
jgi:gluconolactonase